MYAELEDNVAHECRKSITYKQVEAGGWFGSGKD